MSIIQKTTPSSQSDTKPLVAKSFQTKRPSSATTAIYASRDKLHKHDFGREPAIKSVLEKKSHWTMKERREAYLEASIEQGIAWQIKVNRTLRGWSQKHLAELIGTQQSAISRLEDPEYGGHSLDTLVEVAKAFDCALTVKLISYSELAVDSQRLSESDQFAAPFSFELESFSG